MRACDVWQARRWSHRRLERIDPGFGLLLDAYAMVDVAVARAVTRHTGALACKQGCAACCGQPIPVAPLELALLFQYARLHAVQPAGAGSACPFLGEEGCCQVYPVRPVACRQFVVFDAPCRAGEDVLTTRPAQVLRPDYAAMNAALAHTLPWYANWPDVPSVPSVPGVQNLSGVPGTPALDHAAATTFVRSHTVVMQQAVSSLLNRF